MRNGEVMRVLVTGGRGFVGQAVVQTLRAHGHDVVELSRASGVDLRDGEAVARAVARWRPDGVCHLAALISVRDSFAQPLDYFDTNLVGTANLLHALVKPARVVMTSTSAVYGSARPGRLGEDLPPQPESPYAASKAAAEQLLAHVAGAGAIGAFSLRCFNIAGAAHGRPDPDRTRIVSASLRAAAGEIDHVSVNGDGSAMREFTHVLDVADAVRLALEAAEPGRHQALNVGTGEGVRMVDVIRAAERVTGLPIKVVHGPPVSEPHTLISDPTRIQSTLGWRPTRSSLERILRDAWEARLATPRARG